MIFHQHCLPGAYHQSQGSVKNHAGAGAENAGAHVEHLSHSVALGTHLSHECAVVAAGHSQVVVAAGTLAEAPSDMAAAAGADVVSARSLAAVKIGGGGGGAAAAAAAGAVGVVVVVLVAPRSLD